LVQQPEPGARLVVVGVAAGAGKELHARITHGSVIVVTRRRGEFKDTQGGDRIEEEEKDLLLL